MSEREHWLLRATELYPASDDPLHELMTAVVAPPFDDVLRPEVLALIARSRRPAVLTNDLERFHGEHWLSQLGLEGVFDPMIDLPNVGYSKPERQAFEFALDRLGEDAANVVFVDDQRQNVEAAASLGMVGVWFDVTNPVLSVADTWRRL